MSESVSPADIERLRRAIAIAARARAHGNHPFGALLMDRDGNALEAENTVLTDLDCTGHAETNLVRMASRQWTPARLRDSALYASTEPCVMCAGAIHWLGVSRVVFALSEAALYALAPAGSGLLRLRCRDLFALRQPPLRVDGPALEDEARAVHAGFWEAAFHR